MVRFDNNFVRELPADPIQHDVPRPTRKACFSRLKPTSVAAPELLAWADAVGAEPCISSEIVADLMRVGFVRGVMNTDNMSILGLTIDYGLYSWLLLARACGRERLRQGSRRKNRRIASADFCADAAYTARPIRRSPFINHVPRNYPAQLAIDALAAGDASALKRLLAVLECPYDEQPAHEDLAVRRPEWAHHKAGCSALSCKVPEGTGGTALDMLRQVVNGEKPIWHLRRNEPFAYLFSCTCNAPASWNSNRRCPSGLEPGRLLVKG